MIIIDPDNASEVQHLIKELRQTLVIFTAKVNKLSNLPIKSITYHVRTCESMEETDLRINYTNMPRV